MVVAVAGSAKAEPTAQAAPTESLRPFPDDGIDTTDPPAQRSKAMMRTGIALTAFASVGLVGGAVVTVADSTHGGDMRGFLTAVVGIPMMAGSALIAAVGVPLWVLGAAPSPKSVPQFAIGVGSATARWTF